MVDRSLVFAPSAFRAIGGGEADTEYFFRFPVHGRVLLVPINFLRWLVVVVPILLDDFLDSLPREHFL